MYTELFFILSTSNNTTENIYESSSEFAQSKYTRSWSTTEKPKTIRNKSCRKSGIKIQLIQNSDLVENSTGCGKYIKYLYKQNIYKIIEIDICNKIFTGAALIISLENIQTAICTVTQYKNKQNQYTVPEDSNKNKFSTAPAAENIIGFIQIANNK